MLSELPSIGRRVGMRPQMMMMLLPPSVQFGMKMDRSGFPSWIAAVFRRFVMRS